MNTSMISQVVKVQERSGCARAQAWLALTHCQGDADAAIELARRLTPSQPDKSKRPQILPSAEVMSAMYPSCSGVPQNQSERVQILAEASGAGRGLASAALQMCSYDVGAALAMLVI